MVELNREQLDELYSNYHGSKFFGDYNIGYIYNTVKALKEQRKKLRSEFRSIQRQYINSESFISWNADRLDYLNTMGLDYMCDVRATNGDDALKILYKLDRNTTRKKLAVLNEELHFYNEIIKPLEARWRNSSYYKDNKKKEGN